jgi:predicted peptidase
MSIWTLHAFAAETSTQTPVPGKQTAQTVILPASTANRRPPTVEERNAERARRDALTQEQRDAEDKERRDKNMLTLQPLSDTETQTISYWLFLPNDYKPNGKKFPLLLFLHGSGERGNNIDKVKSHGPAKILNDPEKAKDWQFITVSPQCPANYSWSPAQLMKLLEDVEKKYNVDENRIYVTGLSMGGFGTWGLLYHFPNHFAAGVPICGGFNPNAAETFVDTPIWVFHGAKDTAVKLSSSTNVVDAIKAKGGEKVKLTVYPDLGHDSWTVTYDNPEIYSWLLEQKRNTETKNSTNVRKRFVRPLLRR